MDLHLHGRRAIVTGGTRGLGRAIAEQLIAEGVIVTVSGASAENCQIAAEELGETARVVRADIRDLDATKQLVSDVVENHGGIDILINNAGRFAGGSLSELSDEVWLNEVGTKLFGAIRTTREALPHLLEGGGVVVNIAGGSAHSAGGPASISGVNNSGMINFTAFLAREFAGQGLRACSVSPGMTLTASWRERGEAAANARGVSPEEALDGILAGAGAGHARWVETTEIAQLVTFLASDRAAAVNGSNVRANAGQSPVVG
jgi:NAD(P)-dependent dehydrogenase (short-subunit alcohol dehydrogenase family)